MINLNDYRQNIYHNEGIYECPHYSEDGVILKIFEIIGVNKNPLIIEFGETRSLGTTTRAFRIKYKSPSIYFTGNLNIRSRLLNLIDILKVTYNYTDPQYLKFIFNMPFKFFVTPMPVKIEFNYPAECLIIYLLKWAEEFLISWRHSPIKKNSCVSLTSRSRGCFIFIMTSGSF